MLNNAVFAKTIENVRKDRDIKLAPTERRRNYSVSGPNYHTTKFFTGKLLAIERKILMNKLVYLGLSILKFSKILMYELWYDYVKPKYLKKNKNVLYEYRQLHWLCKSRYITENVKNKIWHFKLWIIEWPMSKRKKSNWINERWIKLKNRDTIYWIKSKNLLLLKR